MNSFKDFVHSVIVGTPIISRLEDKSALVIERIAMGGGATRWYYCTGKNSLPEVEDRLKPGSCVSFYFDDRIPNVVYSPEIKLIAEELISKTGEIVIGILRQDGIQLDVEIVSDKSELAEITSTLGAGDKLFYGVFPGRDDDGLRAVTVMLPDQDGLIRSHPY